MALTFITVRNPANGMLSEVSERAFENVYKHKGFERVEQGRQVPPAVQGKAPVEVEEGAASLSVTDQRQSTQRRAVARSESSEDSS